MAAKLIVRSDIDGAEIEISKSEAGYGGTCNGSVHKRSETGQVFHKRHEDAIELAMIHMDIWHDGSTR